MTRNMRKMKTRKLTGGGILSAARAIGSNFAYNTLLTKYPETIELRKLNAKIEEQRNKSLNNSGLWDLDATIIRKYNLNNYKRLSSEKHMFKAYETDENFKNLVNRIVKGQPSYNSIYEAMYGHDISLLIKQIGNNENKESIISKFKSIKSKVDTFIECLKLLQKSYQYKFLTGIIVDKEHARTWSSGRGANLILPSSYKDNFDDETKLVYDLQELLRLAIEKFESNAGSDQDMLDNAEAEDPAEAEPETGSGQQEPATTSGGKYLRGIMRKKYTKKRRVRRMRM